MSAIKPVIRELKQAVLDGMGHARNKLHHLADNLTDHFDNVVREVRGIDKFDAPDGSTPGSGPSAPTWRPDLSLRPSTMSDADYLDLLDSSVHNPDGLEAILGKFYVPGTASYVDVAEGRQPPATYFSLGDQWGDIADAHNMTDKDMFTAFNVPFLERMIAEGKPITFSHNPLDYPGSALADELDFLERNGYRFDPTTMQAVLR